MENINQLPNLQPIQPVEPIKNKNVFKYLFIISIFVILGVIVGSYFILNNKINQLNNKQTAGITSIPTQTTIGNEIIPTAIPTIASTKTPVISVNAGPYISNGYFMVPNWGVKFKLSDELTDYGYSVSPESLSNSFGNYLVGLTAVFKKDLQSAPQSQYYATIDNCSIVTVSRTNNIMPNLSGPKKVIKFGDYSYVVYDFNASGSCKDEGSGLMTNNYYTKVADKLTEILSNPENL